MNELETALQTIKAVAFGAFIINGLLLGVLAVKFSWR